MIYLEAGWWVPSESKSKIYQLHLSMIYTAFWFYVCHCFCVLMLLFLLMVVVVVMMCVRDTLHHERETEWRKEYFVQGLNVVAQVDLVLTAQLWLILSFPSSVSSFCAEIPNMKQQRWLCTLNISMHVLLTWICCNFYVCFLIQEGHEVLLDALVFILDILNNQANQVP